MPYLTFFFVCLVGYLLYQGLSNIAWSEVRKAWQEISPKVFVPGLLLALFNYFILSNYDYMGLRYLNHRDLSYVQVLPSAFVCYAFNLNFSAIVGGLGLRYRIYTGWGLPGRVVPLLMLFSSFTNWSGYVLLLSLVLTTRPEMIVKLIDFPLSGFKLMGVVGLLIIITYLLFCLRHFQLNFRELKFRFPRLSFGILQLIMSCFQWVGASGIIYYFFKYFGAEVGFEQVLFTYLLSSIAGLLAHIPAGLGVVEAVFLKMQFGMAREDVLVALICFRIVYYLVPLALAFPTYLYLEFYQAKAGRNHG